MSSTAVVILLVAAFSFRRLKWTGEAVCCYTLAALALLPWMLR